MVAIQNRIVHQADQFSHDDACRVEDLALSCGITGSIVVDLSSAREASTAAFARLVLVRRHLLRTGRDLKLKGLRDQAAKMYEVNRLQGILPSH